MKRSFKRAVIAAALVAVMAPASALGGDRENSLSDGAWALQFGIADNLRLTSYQGGFFSLKRHFSDRSAVRTVFDFGFSTSDGESGSTDSSNRVDTSSDRWNTAATLLYQRYLNPEAEVVVYFGLGPTFAYDDRSDEEVLTQVGTDTSSTSTRDYTAWSVGAATAFGAEFFATEHISLHAEYATSLWYSSRETVYKLIRRSGDRVKSVSNSDGWSFNSSYLRFGLSAYF